MSFHVDSRASPETSGSVVNHCRMMPPAKLRASVTGPHICSERLAERLRALDRPSHSAWAPCSAAAAAPAWLPKAGMPAPRNLAVVALAQRWRATRQSRISSRAQNSRHQVRVSPPSHPPPSDPSQRARAHSSSHANSLTAFFCLAPVAVRHVTPDNPWLPLLSAQQVVEIAGAFHKFGARRVPVARLRIGLLLRAHVLAPTLRHHRALLRTPLRTPSHACMRAARSCLELLGVCVSLSPNP